MNKQGWKEYKLGEVAEIKYGKDHKHLADGNIPVYGSGGIMRYANKALYEKPSILIPRKGTLSNLFYVTKPFWSVDTMFYTKIKENVDSQFLFYLIKTLDLASMNVGSAVPSLTTEILNKIEISLPDIEIQRRIAAILSSLDEKIELNRQMNQTLEETAQTLFREMCLPKGDVLPEGWEVRKISELINVKDGTHNSPKQQEDGYYLITSKHLKNGIIDFEQAYKISEYDYIEVNKRSLVERFDILITMIGTVGNIHLVMNEDINFAIKNIGLFKSSENINLFGFLYCSLNSAKTKEYFGCNLAGSTQQYLTLKSLRDTPIVLPNESVLLEFEKQANPLFFKIYENNQEITTLTQLRDNLLPKLMSGEIDLR